MSESGLTNPDPWLQQWADAQRPTPPPVSPRIQHMIQVVLEHQREICHYATGTLELHFHDASVKAKITLHLPS
jgi:hypothetical protein